MPNEELEQKLCDLETRLAFQEDHLSACNKRIAEQDLEIAKLQLQLKHLNEKFQNFDSGSSDAGSPADERPPHY